MIAIAIDGPSGAGKSTLSQDVAKKLGILYVDTGALYRTIGLAALRAGANPKNADAVEKLLPGIRLDMKHVAGGQRVFLGGEDVSEAIRAEEVGMAASAVSAHPAVRAHLLDMQRGLAKVHDVIMDGRDIGTVVLPGAQIKVFLTAAPEARAKRRTLQLKEKGEAPDYEKVLADVKQRDYDDSHRAAAPLKQAEDAVLLDTTEYDYGESLEKLLELIKEKWTRG